jgi:hypothetical protein
MWALYVLPCFAALAVLAVVTHCQSPFACGGLRTFQTAAQGIAGVGLVLVSVGCGRIVVSEIEISSFLSEPL